MSSNKPISPVSTRSLPVIETSFTRIDTTYFEGSAFDPKQPDRRFAVEILLDGTPVKLLRAELFRPHLLQAGIGDGCYGFAFSLPPEWLTYNQVVGARLANAGTSVGAPIVLHAPLPSQPSRSQSNVEWAGGLHVTGWLRLPDDATDAVAVVARIDGRIAAKMSPRDWTQVIDANGETLLARVIDIFFASEFADGRVHAATIETENGAELGGSPLRFMAMKNRVASLLRQETGLASESAMEPLLRQLCPSSWPMHDYAGWKTRWDEEASAPPTGDSVALILVGDGDAEASIASLRSQLDAKTVVAALRPRGDQARFSGSDLRDALRSAHDADFVLFAIAGTIFADHAIPRLTAALGDYPRAVAAYPDVEIALADGATYPVFFPAFDAERNLEQGYAAHVFMVRGKHARLIAEQTDAETTLYRAFNALLAFSDSAENILHVPGPGALLPPLEIPRLSTSLRHATEAYLQARGIDASVEPSAGFVFPAVKVKRTSEAKLLSIVLPHLVSDDDARLADFLGELAENPAVEIIVVHAKTGAAPLEQAPKHGKNVKSHAYSGVTNVARMINLAAAKAKGETLCLLRSPLDGLGAEPLAEMQSRLSDPGTGAVAPLIVWPSGVISHGGIVLGPHFSAANAFSDALADDPGYADLLRVAHEVSAVSGACLVTRKSDFAAAGGLDAALFPNNLYAIDYCLKLRARGRRIVLTPHASLVQSLSVTDASTVDAPGAHDLLQRELAALRWRWGEVIGADPFYSPALALDRYPYRTLAWPLRPMQARTAHIPQPHDIPRGA